MSEADRRLRIAFVVHDYNRHMGHSRYVAELAARFKRAHEVHVFSNTFEEPDPSGITYHHVPAWRANALTTILTYVLPATAILRGRFDVIHAQGLCGLRHDVATAHFCQPGWYGALRRANGRLTGRQALSRALITPLEKLALSKRSTRRVIAIASGVRDDLERYYGRSDGVRVIYHGVDVETFHPRNRARFREEMRADLGVAPGDDLALFVGNLQKGAAAAIRAVARAPGARLLLVSNSDTRGDLAVARAEGIEDRVTFRPYSRQIERYFAAADVFVFPTLFEPYGMVISEAMASGVPAVTSRAAGASELIDHGKSGWLVDDPWDAESIAEGLRALFASAELRKRMGAAARAAIEPFSWDRNAEETMSVYREVLAERAR